MHPIGKSSIEIKRSNVAWPEYTPAMASQMMKINAEAARWTALLFSEK